jgi:hypothetical protein
MEIELKRISGKYAVMMGGGLKWLRLVSHYRLWY